MGACLSTAAVSTPGVTGNSQVTSTVNTRKGHESNVAEDLLLKVMVLSDANTFLTLVDACKQSPMKQITDNLSDQDLKTINEHPDSKDQNTRLYFKPKDHTIGGSIHNESYGVKQTLAKTSTDPALLLELSRSNFVEMPINVASNPNAVSTDRNSPDEKQTVDAIINELIQGCYLDDSLDEEIQLALINNPGTSNHTLERLTGGEAESDTVREKAREILAVRASMQTE